MPFKLEMCRLWDQLNAAGICEAFRSPVAFHLSGVIRVVSITDFTANDGQEISCNEVSTHFGAMHFSLPPAFLPFLSL